MLVPDDEGLCNGKPAETARHSSRNFHSRKGGFSRDSCCSGRMRNRDLGRAITCRKPRLLKCISTQPYSGSWPKRRVLRSSRAIRREDVGGWTRRGGSQAYLETCYSAIGPAVKF